MSVILLSHFRNELFKQRSIDAAISDSLLNLFCRCFNRTEQMKIVFFLLIKRGDRKKLRTFQVWVVGEIVNRFVEHRSSFLYFYLLYSPTLSYIRGKPLVEI